MFPGVRKTDDLLKVLEGRHGTSVKVNENGRVNINLDHQACTLIDHLKDLIKHKRTLQDTLHSQDSAPLPEKSSRLPPLRGLNVVIQIVGSRGDVQPFVALGQALKETYGHRVRLATHATFQKLVEDNGLEFFNIGGDPAALMAFMVKNPGLMPGFETIKKGDVGKHRHMMYEIMKGCWRSCIEPGDGMDYEEDSRNGHRMHAQDRIRKPPALAQPFIADAIIANPPSFAHIHLAERLGIPLHMFFTMPWTPTHAFPHPIANIHSTSADASTKNYMSYGLVELLTWQGLGDIVNDFRQKYLHLDPLNLTSAPGIEDRLRIPFTYCWSPTLIPKPSDWGPQINICGFFFLPRLATYKPDPKLEEFLAVGPPPVYIGFGSIVVKDPKAFTKMIFDATKMAGVRALVSQGWGGFGAGEAAIPDGVMLLGDTPHDWLFENVSAVVHHGGAGTTAAGIRAGKPTVVVPFFGDQPFWGAMVARAGAGPTPVPFKDLTAEKLAHAITEALQPGILEKAEAMGKVISSENGLKVAVKSFAATIEASNLRCDIFPHRAAGWMLNKTIKLSTLAAAVLDQEGLLKYKDLRLYRPKQYDTDDRWGIIPIPLLALSSALIDTLGGVIGGLLDYPVLAVQAYQHANYHLHHLGDEENPPPKEGEQTTIMPPPGQSADPSEPMFDKDPHLANVSNNIAIEKEQLSPPTPPNVNFESSVSPDPAEPSQAQHSSTLHNPSVTTSLHPSIYPTASHTWHNAPVTTMMLDRTLGSGFGIGRVVGSLLKFPLLLSLGLTRAFHRFPLLYHDPTIRPLPRISGYHSGLSAAGTVFVTGFSDAVTGFVRLPVLQARAAKRKGGSRVKAVGKGVGQALAGAWCKPAEACWGVPAYVMQGVHWEIARYLARAIVEYVREVRVERGELEVGEWRGAEVERERVREEWARLVRRVGR